MLRPVGRVRSGAVLPTTLATERGRSCTTPSLTYGTASQDPVTSILLSSCTSATAPLWTRTPAVTFCRRPDRRHHLLTPMPLLAPAWATWCVWASTALHGSSRHTRPCSHSSRAPKMAGGQQSSQLCQLHVVKGSMCICESPLNFCMYETNDMTCADCWPHYGADILTMHGHDHKQ